MRNQKRDFKIRALGRENAKNSFSIHATPGNLFVELGPSKNSPSYNWREE